MKLALTQEMRVLDHDAVTKFGVPSLVLMENAGLRVVESIELKLPKLAGARVRIIAGKGNNGGDGFVIARHLANRGAEIEVLLAARKDEVTGDASLNLRMVERMGLPIVEIVRPSDVKRAATAIAASDLVVDALFGTGLSRRVSGVAAKLIQAANGVHRPIVAVDVPSGINANTGAVLGCAVRATWTVTLALPKRGVILHPGAEHAGEVLVGDLGVPRKMLADENIRANLATPDLIASWLPARAATAHKGSMGSVLLVGGSGSMAGAAFLAARAAMRGGAGLCAMAIPKSINLAAKKAVIEATTLPLAETVDQTIAEDALDSCLEAVRRSRVMAIGPGLSRNGETARFARRLVASTPVPMVIDADAIVAWSRRCGELRQVAGTKILTPHPGEMASLLGVSIAQVERDRIAVALRCAQECGATVLLKGARSVIANEEGEVWVNVTGNPGMATGGSGDVLTGLIASLVAQGMSPMKATVAGAYLHGLAGDLAAAQRGQRGVIAGDLIDLLPDAFARLASLHADNQVAPRLYRLL